MNRWASLWAAALLAAALLPSPAAGASRATTFCITVKPYLAEGVRVLVDGVDNNDWEALNGRPDNPNVLHNRVVQPGQLCVGLEVRRRGGPPQAPAPYPTCTLLLLRPPAPHPPHPTCTLLLRRRPFPPTHPHHHPPPTAACLPAGLPQVNHYSAPAFTLTLVYPPNGPEVAREAVRPSLCSYAWVMMSYCSKEASWSEEVLDYTTVTWAY